MKSYCQICLERTSFNFATISIFIRAGLKFVVIKNKSNVTKKRFEALSLIAYKQCS